MEKIINLMGRMKIVEQTDEIPLRSRNIDFRK